jgi:hypothetical protein
MKVAYTVILAILVFLAVSSGITKIMQMEQDVEFFGQYGFSIPMLIGFGILQVIGGALLLVVKTRIIGAILIALTFVISVYLLILEGNAPFTIATLCALLLLGLVIAKTRRDVAT